MKNLLTSLLVLLTVSQSVATTYATPERGSYIERGEVYPYAIRATGDNFSFEFEKSFSKESERLRAALGVFKTVYDDYSIKPTYVQAFSKEGASCYVFDANLYSYTTCFLPNDYSPDHRDRFWGYVTRLPNLKWLITMNLLPALVLIGAFFYFLRRKS